jgi:hypothetical protein
MVQKYLESTQTATKIQKIFITVVSRSVRRQPKRATISMFFQVKHQYFLQN